jgi:hypothetical protein
VNAVLNESVVAETVADAADVSPGWGRPFSKPSRTAKTRYSCGVPSTRLGSP